MQSNYTEASIESIIRPQKAEKGEMFDDWITLDSPKWQREAVVQLRRYLSRECRGYGMSMDSSKSCWKGAEVYSITAWVNDPDADECYHCLVGAVCLEKHKGWVLLSFCWLHPFWRGQDEMKSAWREIKDKFQGVPLLIEEPISKQMQGFLDSVKYVRPSQSELETVLLHDI